MILYVYLQGLLVIKDIRIVIATVVALRRRQRAAYYNSPYPPPYPPYSRGEARY